MIYGSTRFRTSEIVETPGAEDLIKRSWTSETAVIQVHLMGHWGDIPPEDVQVNEAAIRNGELVSRVLSAYNIQVRGPDGEEGGTEELWVISEPVDERVLPDGRRVVHVVTTLLLPEEY